MLTKIYNFEWNSNFDQIKKITNKGSSCVRKTVKKGDKFLSKSFPKNNICVEWIIIFINILSNEYIRFNFKLNIELNHFWTHSTFEWIRTYGRGGGGCLRKYFQLFLRVEIWRDRWDQRSRKILVSCVNSEEIA